MEMGDSMGETERSSLRRTDRRGFLRGAGVAGAGVAAGAVMAGGAPAGADPATSVFFNSGAFVPANPGSTFPDYDVTGLAFDPDSIERAAIWLTAPAGWSSVTIYIVGTSASTGTARFHIEASSSQPAVDLEVTSSFGLARGALVEDHPFHAITGSAFQGVPAALQRDATHGADDLDDDFIVWGLELVEGS